MLFSILPYEKLNMAILYPIYPDTVMPNRRKIFFRDILFIEGMRDYRKIHTSHKKIMTLQKFSELEAALPESVVCRVHKSYMVSINKIDSIEKDIIHISQTVIPVSETYRSKFYALIGR